MELTPENLEALYAIANPILDPPSLRGLDGVDWGAVSHAYGEATNIPALLRAAVSDVAEHREFAFELLDETICHQGTVYEATIPAIRFLYQLLEADDTPDGASVVQSLAIIADAQTGEAEHLEGVRRAVASRFDLLYTYLRDPEPWVRQAVAVVVGQFPDLARRLLPDLEAAYRDESDESVRRALAEVFGSLADRRI